jgi:asparagine synthase (glutamine-hydrolysing)
VDISGFTPLTESLFRFRQDGAEILGDTLAAIFGPLVTAVYATGGLIPLFAGDAFTAIFPVAGGDEMFGGYFRHQALLALELLNRVPKPMIRALRMLLGPLPQNRDNRLGNLVRRVIRFLDQRETKDNNFLTLLRQDRIYPQNSQFLAQAPVNSLVKALEFDFRHFLGDNILSFSDKMSMLYGLEVRVPFLDPGVVRLAEQMRNNQRVTLREKKILLKQLAARYFPRDLIYRKKQGFAAPIEVWLRTLSKKELRQRCLDGLATQMVPEPVILHLIDTFSDQRKDLSLQLYSLIVMNQWYARIVQPNQAIG